MRNPQALSARHDRSPKTIAALLVTTVLAAGFLTGPGIAQDTSWKQNFAACAGNSPYIDGLLASHNEDHRPLMRIGDMQAWAIQGENGQPTLALTTNDGLTIIGSIYGPQGEDISAALLATVPSVAQVLGQTPPAPTFPSPEAQTPLQSTPPPNMSRALTNLTRQLSAPATAVPTAQVPAADAPQSVTPAPQTDVNTAAAPPTAPITASQEPTPEQQVGMDTIFKQATEERIWFSAAQPQEGAPVVYMLTDPECPHCQWTIDNMRAQVLAGEIDLRIIFAPITGVQGFNSSLSILHSEDVPNTFISHMTSKTRGTDAVAQMDTNQADRAVVQGIVDNINWMRTNRMPGVPFFLYMTDSGARFAFSELPSDIRQIAKPL